MNDAIILKDLINEKKKSTVFENSYLAKNVLTDYLNHLDATHFLSLCDPCWGHDPYFENQCYKIIN